MSHKKPVYRYEADSDTRYEESRVRHFFTTLKLLAALALSIAMIWVLTQ